MAKDGLNEYDVLIGMDVIGDGDFLLTNKNGCTEFSFHYPSRDQGV